MEARELRLSLGGGIGDGDDMASCGEAGAEAEGEVVVVAARTVAATAERRRGCYRRAGGRNGGMLRQHEGSMWIVCVAPALYSAETWIRCGGPGSSAGRSPATTRPASAAAVTLPLHTTMATNPPQLFLLADHIKLSLLERQRAVSLNLPAHSQDSQISRSLEQLRSGIEALESQVEDTSDEYACTTHTHTHTLTHIYTHAVLRVVLTLLDP